MNDLTAPLNHLSPIAGLAHAPSPLLRSGLIEDQRSFSAVLGRAGVGEHAAHPESPAATARAKARDAAEQLVAVGLVQPVLKSLRDSNRAAPPFAPSQGERQFRALMDAEVAQRIVRAARFPLVERLAHQLLTRGGPPSETPHAGPD